MLLYKDVLWAWAMATSWNATLKLTKKELKKPQILDYTGSLYVSPPFYGSLSKLDTSSTCITSAIKIKCQYVQVEKEVLAFVHGWESFNIFIYTSSVLTETDSKPFPKRLDYVSSKGYRDYFSDANIKFANCKQPQRNVVVVMCSSLEHLTEIQWAQIQGYLLYVSLR